MRGIFTESSILAVHLVWEYLLYPDLGSRGISTQILDPKKSTRISDPGWDPCKIQIFRTKSSTRLIELNQDVNGVCFFWPKEQLCNISAAS
jgi:hypothetical protein